MCQYSHVIISTVGFQITGVSIVCPIFCWDADQRKHQSSASPDFVRGIHRWPVDSPHKEPVTRKMLPFDDVILFNLILSAPYLPMAYHHQVLGHLQAQWWLGSGPTYRPDNLRLIHWVPNKRADILLAKFPNAPDNKILGPTWGPPGSCRPQMGPILAPWTLLSGAVSRQQMTAVRLG